MRYRLIRRMVTIADYEQLLRLGMFVVAFLPEPE